MKAYKTREVSGGIQKLYKFSNGYGASVVNNDFSYTDSKDEWELAVIKWDKNDYELDYSTEITEDVMGHLSNTEVEETLLKIKLLNGKEYLKDEVIKRVKKLKEVK